MLNKKKLKKNKTMIKNKMENKSILKKKKKAMIMQQIAKNHLIIFPRKPK